MRLLSIVGCDVRGAENGAEAVDEWRRWQPEEPGRPRAVQAFIFACEETGEERVYGCE